MDKIVELEQIEFKNLPDKTTKINAQNLNKIQENTNNALKKVQNVMNEKFNSVFYQNEVTGENINIKDALDYKIEKVTIDGKSAQASTTGKNLFDGELELGTYLTTTGAKYNATDTYRNANYVSINPNTTYTFSIDGTSQKYALYFYDKNKTFLNYNSSLSNGTFTAPDKAYYVNFRCFTADFTSNYTKLKVQLEQGSFATDYEPYTGGEPSPNPSYPQNINSIIGDVLLSITGKNLLKLKDGTYTSNGLTLTIENNILTLNGTNNGTESVFDAIKSSISVLTTSKTKIKSFQIDGTCTNTSETYFRSYVGWTNGINLNFTTSTIKNLNANLVYNNFTIGIKSGTFNNYRFRILIANDLTDNTTYEPYQSNSITIDLQDDELCSIGDVRDQLVIENGNVKIIKKIGKVILNGTESSWLENALVKGLFQITLTNIYGNQALKNAISDYLVGVEGNDAVNPTIYTNNSVSTYTSNRLFLRLNTYANNLNGLKGWLSTHNITVYYVLETSQEIDLGSLSEENIEKLKTFAGSNNIIVNASLDTNVSIKYGLDLKKYIDNKIENLSDS